MSNNIQDTVFEIIKFAKHIGIGTITKTRIKEQLLISPLGTYEREHWNGDNSSKLDRMLDQALYQLSKNNKIKKRGRGKYSLDTDIKYKPVICRHIELRERGPYCPIKRCYIGEPKLQCEVLHGTDYTTKTKIVFPMCPGYTDKKPTENSVEYAKKVLEEDYGSRIRQLG